MLYIASLKAGLENLADPEFQRRAWLASSGLVVSSFSEDICQVFDDTGLSDILESERCPPELQERTFIALRDLSEAVSLVNQEDPPAVLLESPAVEKVRRLAAAALDLLRRQ